MLEAPPQVGCNRHQWLYKLQFRLIKVNGFDAHEVETRTEKLCEIMGWEDRLAEVAKNTEKIVKLDLGGTSFQSIKWPEPHDEARRGRFTSTRLFKLEDSGLTTADVLPRLFTPEEWVCVAATRYRSYTQKMDGFLSTAHQLQFIVPNPMAKKTGITKEGKASARAKDNACTEQKRRILVVEFDTHDALEDQAAVLSSLSTPRAPLCLVVYSGGKSLHGWYNVSKLTTAEKLDLFQFAVYLRADYSLWNTAGLVRMPGGTRDTGKKQYICFFNPEVMPL